MAAIGSASRTSGCTSEDNQRTRLLLNFDLHDALFLEKDKRSMMGQFSYELFDGSDLQKVDVDSPPYVEIPSPPPVFGGCRELISRAKKLEVRLHEQVIIRPKRNSSNVVKNQLYENLINEDHTNDMNSFIQLMNSNKHSQALPQVLH
ncbi:hypothetical protein NECAME_16127 [Necator americanus]|uniref:Uncharacterized protein n=1 Tax=Necator americanus TaxID=51031 RepID=W2TY67_NECAM|nr:hypothetical protein NECAME_16127 [Necator americanus]ETN86783.1 hypothetical protein NECAME_16127 [Necator americanus]